MEASIFATSSVLPYLEPTAVVRFGAHNGLRSDMVPCPKVPRADIGYSLDHLIGEREY